MGDVGLERFRGALFNLLRRDIFEPNENSLRLPFDPAPGPDLTSRLSRDQQLLAEIFWGALEIWETLDVLRDVEKYISRSPHSQLGIPRSRHLIYHFSSYLNEMYILRERAGAFCKILLRKYKKNRQNDRQTITDANRTAASELSKIVEVRGSHVHQRRFHDAELHRLAGFEIAQREEGFEERLRVYSRRMAGKLYREQRQRWLNHVQSNNTEITKLLDNFFDALYPVLFDRDGELIRPQHWRAS